MAVIKTSQATIKTCSVEIKALTVDKRQVTMGLIRQLHQEKVVDLETMEFRGLPWGRVNYFWKGCTPCYDPDWSGSIIHVVWQKDSELRRDVVPTHVHSYAKELNRDLDILDVLRHVALCRSNPFTLKWEQSVGKVIEFNETACCLENLPAPKTYQRVVEALERAPLNTNCMQDRSWEMRHPGQQETSLDEALSLLERLLGKHAGPLDFTLEDAGAAQESNRLQGSIEWFTESWAERYRELEALDQLFIAV
jgi:hypothetical protein